MMESFYVTLPSNSSMDLYPENTISHFKVHLKEQLQLLGEWEVGMTELLFPANWHNMPDNSQTCTLDKSRYLKHQPETEITMFFLSDAPVQSLAEFIAHVNETLGHTLFSLNSQNQVTVTMPDNIRLNLTARLVNNLRLNRQHFLPGTTMTGRPLTGPPQPEPYPMQLVETPPAVYEEAKNKTVTIPGGHYTTPEEVLKYLNRLKNGLFTLDENSGRVKCSLDSHEQVTMTEELAALLGFTKHNLNGKDKSEHIATFTFDPRTSFYNIFIYSDLIKPQFVGNTRARLLQVTPAPEKHDEMVSHVFNPVQYLPLETKNFQTINIDIRNSAGSYIPFTGGLSIVKLHFRQRQI